MSKNILLIDTRVQDYETIVSAVNRDVCIPVTFDYFTETLEDIKAKLLSYVSTVNRNKSSRCIGLLQHNYNNRPYYTLVKPTTTSGALTQGTGSRVSKVAEVDPTLQTWAPLRDLIAWCKTTPEVNAQYFDMMACALYSDTNWKYVIDTLTTQTGLEIRASTDNTGASSLGGNWFLESHTGVNLKTVYFTEAIEEYKGLLYGDSKLKESRLKSFSTGSVLTWGDSEYGGDSSSVSSSLQPGVVSIYSSNYAFAALKSDGSVITWGEPYNGGDSSSVDLSSGIVSIFSNAGAFAALKSNGSVITWGNSEYGGDSISVSSSLQSGVVTVHSNVYAFAALKSDDSVITWGEPYNGGDSSSVDLSSGIVSIFSTAGAFAALKSNGSVITWGDSYTGGDSSSVSSSLSSGVVSIYSTYGAFAALKSDGSVIIWGDSWTGGDSSSVSSSLSSGVISIYSNDTVFAALKSDGSVITWGHSSFGADSSSVSSSLSSGVISIYSNEAAFAALKSDGSVITWGSSGDGGDSSSVSSSLSSGVISIYYNESAFAALKSDGSVITWGYSYTGGDSSSVSSSLSSGVVSIYSNESAFAALKSDGSVITWGSSGDGGDSSSVSSSLSSGVISIYSTFEAVAALKTTASTFDLSMSYYTDIDKYKILSNPNNRRRVDLTTLNNNVFTLSESNDIKSINPTLPTTASLKIIVPDYVASSYSITSTATMPNTSGSFIVACDASEPVTISGTTYVNYGGYVYKRETDNTYTKTTSATVNSKSYSLYGGDGVNSSGIAFVSQVVPCFLEGTTILALKDGVEQYVQVESLRKGTLVKTYKHGYKAVEVVGTAAIMNSGDSSRSENRLFKCDPAAYPELASALFVTGGHSILVDALTPAQRDETVKSLGKIFKTDDKFRLTARIDSRSQPWGKEKQYSVWHFALENNEPSMNYGVYANGGLLVETCSLRYLKTRSNMSLRNDIEM